MADAGQVVGPLTDFVKYSVDLLPLLISRAVHYGPERAFGDDSRRQGVAKGGNGVQHVGSQIQEM
jgi:hypothetical protein